ncbi:sensor histidine kinase [Chondromyces apiculatus]|uniref:histidine kinase n=1 Tax=Chondromyces apiculatus DSM 436 TaxID=1192034 RepID=A0A017T2F9_9BACT|nr:HAMP domain-containing sensor histidine kinase [Chondromyces apiculatus]EYF02736.1 Two-component sensor PilS [Chondromyces apiculatus DSM 436]
MSDVDTADLACRAARLAAAGAVGASVAHELRNALAVAESSLFLAQRDLDDRALVSGHLTKVSAEIRKAQQVIGSVLGLARGEPLRCEPAPLRQFIEGARHGLVAPGHIRFETAVEPADLTVCCDPVLLERVFSNLYLNAIDALASSPEATIWTRAWRADERTWIEVEDNGPGLPATVMERIFEPLATTKVAGTGLGLTLSRVIVEAHRGEITVMTSKRGGAVFRLWLPIVSDTICFGSV